MAALESLNTQCVGRWDERFLPSRRGVAWPVASRCDGWSREVTNRDERD